MSPESSKIETRESVSGEPEWLKQGRKDLQDILARAREKEQEIKDSKTLSPARKAEEIRKIVKTLREEVIKVLESWKKKIPEIKEWVDGIIKDVEARAKGYELDAYSIEKEAAAIAQATTQTSADLAAQSDKAASGLFMPPAPTATRAEKEKFWSAVLQYRKSTYRGEFMGIKSPFSIEANMDSMVRRTTNNIKVLDKDTAEILVKYNPKDEELCLDGVETITEDVIDILGQNLGTIFLKGLKQVNKDVFRKLLGKDQIRIFVQSLDVELVQIYNEETRKDGGHAYLDTDLIEKLDDERLAKALTACKYGLELNGLTTLTEPVAKALATHKHGLSLGGITKLTEPVAKALATHQGYLELNGLTMLTEPVAKALAVHQGDLKLDGLTTLTEQVARALSGHKGQVYLNNLNKESREIWSALPETEMLKFKGNEYEITHEKGIRVSVSEADNGNWLIFWGPDRLSIGFINLNQDGSSAFKGYYQGQEEKYSIEYEGKKIKVSIRGAQNNEMVAMKEETEGETSFPLIKKAFDSEPSLHEGLSWETVEAGFKKNPDAVKLFTRMLIEGHSPNIFIWEKDCFYIGTCAISAPDKNKSYEEAEEAAKAMGLQLMTQLEYGTLMRKKSIDGDSHSWLHKRTAEEKAPVGTSMQMGILYTDPKNKSKLCGWRGMKRVWY